MTPSRLIRIWRQRLLSLFRKEQLDGELHEELAFHLEQLQQENLTAGMNPDEARSAARRALGNLEVFKEECRDQRRTGWVHDFRQDVRYGMRMMGKHPGLTSIAAFSLALGIGGNAAILGVGTSLLFRDLPLPRAEQLVMIRAVQNQNPEGIGLASIPELTAWKTANRSFQSLGASFPDQQDFATDENSNYPESISGQGVTPSLFETLQVQPQLGRVLRDEDALAGAPAPVIVLSHRLWQRRFRADPEIVGKKIRMNGKDRTIIGVMPDGFWYPNEATEFWIPLGFNSFQLKGSERLFNVTGRLREGVTITQAQSDLRGVEAQLAGDVPETYRNWSVWVVPMREAWFGWVSQLLLTLQIAVIVVLLIACANVSTLLLGRVSERRPEIVMRQLLGADRGRIVRQFLTESLLLSILGGALSLLVAWWGVHLLEAIQPPAGRIPIAGMIQIGRIPWFTASLSVMATLLFGFLPMNTAFSSANDIHQASLHGRNRSLSAMLVSVQIGLALFLLICSGLLLNSFVRLVLDDHGFDPSGILTFQYRIPVQDYVRPLGSYHGMPTMDAAPPTQAIQRVYENLRRLPGAESVAGSSNTPVNGILLQNAVLHIEGREAPQSPSDLAAARVVYFLVTDSFFATMKTPLVRGRDFDARDTASSPWVTVVNETLARRFWPGGDPIGRHFTVDAILGEQPREVIGVVRDVDLNYIPKGRPQPVAYTLYLQQPQHYQGLNTGIFGQMTFYVRSGVDPWSLVPEARRAVAEIDPDRPISSIQTMEQFLGDSIKVRRFSVSAMAIFALMAMLLAAIGVYGVMTYSVSQQTREIGIRKAMGADGLDIILLIGNRILPPLAIGLSLGLVTALSLTPLIEAQLWGITSRDPATYIAAVVLVMLVSLAACLYPLRRALRVDPTAAVKME